MIRNDGSRRSKEFGRSNSGSGYSRKYSFTNGTDSNLYGDLPVAFGSTRTSYGDKLTRKDYEELEKTVDNYFNKKFFFQPPLNNWELPDPEVMFTAPPWEIKRLQDLKFQLNTVKNKLNDYDLDKWHKHTRAMNKAGDIQWKLRNDFKPEFMTQAWCKFYENVSTFTLVPPVVVETNNFNSVHLCEAPGAFITSLNHFLKLHFPNVQWNWLATTLNPYYEGNPLSCMINDDRFILQTLDHWRFGEDYTGDLMNVRNMKDLVEESKEMGEVLLVTADGSIDCQEDPGEQEKVVSSLHYCEAVSALHLLAKGGSFLLKMFTMYEYETICLMYLLNCAFKSVKVCKPATSKEGNSEVYVVCLEYQGVDVLKPWLVKLRKHFGPSSPDKAMFPKDYIPSDFLEQLCKCANMFRELQSTVIESNILAYARGGRDFKTKKLRYMISEHFMKFYEMNSLEEEQEVVGKSKLKETLTLNLDPRTEEGSFNERCRKKALNPEDRMAVLEDELQSMRIQWPWEEDIKWLKFNQTVSGFSIKTGKPVPVVHSSKFCLGRLLRIRNEVRELSKHLKSNLPSASKGKNTGNEDDNSVLAILDKRDMTKQLTQLNFKAQLWSLMEAGDNERAEYTAFHTIMETINEMWRDHNLLLQGYPMLTQFNVGVIYMLSHMFDKVGFIKPHKQDFGLIFVGYRSWNFKVAGFLDEVINEFEECEGSEGQETVLAVLPINLLCGKRPDDKEEQRSSSRGESDGDCSVTTEESESANAGSVFYKCVTEVNHLCVKEQISDITSAYS